MKICYIPPTKEKINIMDKALLEISALKNRKAAIIMTSGVFILMNTTTLLAKSTDPVTELGFSAVGIIQTVITFIGIFAALYEIGKSLLDARPQAVPGIIIKYGIPIVCLYVIPVIYFQIGDTFNEWFKEKMISRGMTP